MIGWIVKLGTKLLSFLGLDIVDRVLSYFEHKADGLTERTKIGAQVTIEEIKADVAARNAARDIVIAEQGWWLTAMIRPLFAYPTIAYYGAVIADSLFHFHWSVAQLPNPIGNWAGWILAAYFVTRPIEKVVRGLNYRKGKS
ncbi:hypothetical protein [uncultured Cohaesibacter sp.]|uniref:hypothetical protein n=1 Tax=uncultured Cohaesibacter sp. TaxID=1002546 RepID=UPI002AAC2914|nr:hypothetical protein [uncultured Cohaesibacter sp.]